MYGLKQKKVFYEILELIPKGLGSLAEAINAEKCFSFLINNDWVSF